MNNLDINRLSIWIDSYVLWDQTTNDTWFGSDVSRKVRGSDFCLWEQNSHCNAGSRKTLERSFL